MNVFFIDKFRSFLWLAPFLGFMAGYYVMTIFFANRTVEVPNIVGKPLNQALRILTKKSLHAHVIHEQESADLPEGVIVEQRPKPGRFLRLHQVIYIGITKRPEVSPTSHYVGKSYQEIQQLLSKQPVRSEIHWIKSNYPKGTCIAQWPAVHKRMDASSVILYFSSGTEMLFVVPNFRDQMVNDVLLVLRSYSVEFSLVHNRATDEQHTCNTCHVLDQRPLPGSIINLEKKLPLQLHVGS